MSPARRAASQRGLPRLVSELPIEDLIGANALGYVPTLSRASTANLDGDLRRGRTDPWLRRVWLVARAIRWARRQDDLVSTYPLTSAERRCGELPAGPSKQVYAPASARVPKPPAPGDER